MQGLSKNLLNNIKDTKTRISKHNKKKMEAMTLPSFDYLFNNAYFSVREMYLFGSRKSAKTKHIALRIIFRMLKDKDYNALIMRKVAGELNQSIKEEIDWAINLLGVDELFHYHIQKRVFEYLPTGQRILCKGISTNPSSGKPSLSGLIIAKGGTIKDVWLEECWEFTKEDYQMIKGTIRGGSYTLLLTGNPYFSFIWCVKQAINLLEPKIETLKNKGEMWAYFKPIRKQRLESIVHWNNYQMNKFLSKEDVEEREQEAYNNPKDSIVSVYGYPGSPTGTILGDLTHKIQFISLQTYNNTMKEPQGGVDIGLTNDATSCIMGGMSHQGKQMIAGEYYHSNGLQECNRFSDNGKWRKKDPDELAIDVLAFFMMFKNYWHRVGRKFKVAVDSADRAFIKMLNNKCLVQGVESIIKFVPTIGAIQGKKTIEDRIIFERLILSHNFVQMVKIDNFITATQLLYEMDNLPWKINVNSGLKVQIRDDSKVPDHNINAWEYSFRKNQQKTLKFMKI